ncbi:MAG: hypothetical protein INR64_09135 [Caulobacteraceae bacterium]|nr:hypothetical protein [Caulobacter sp.]
MDPIITRIADFGRGGWRPALGWALTPCALYAFILGPWLRRPADTAELVALLAAAGGLVAARTVEKARGIA